MSAGRPRPTENYTREFVGPIVALAHLRGDASAAVQAIVDGLVGLRVDSSTTGLMLILHSGAVPPDESDRALFVDAIRDPAVCGVAVALLGEGFWAAAARSVMTFFAVTSRLPVRLFGSPKAASEWLITRFGDAPAPDRSALEETTRQLAGLA